jgi:hypothetical protein
VHEENRAVVQPHELSELGKVTGKRFPMNWGIRAMVALGGDVLTLDFPGVSPPKRRTPHRPAKWTRGPARPGMEPEQTPVERLRLAKQKSMEAEAQKEKDKAQNAAALAELKERQDERRAKARERARERVLKKTEDTGPMFPYEQATEAEERDHIAWALARNQPADPGSTPLQRIQAGAKRSHE